MTRGANAITTAENVFITHTHVVLVVASVGYAAQLIHMRTKSIGFR